MGKGPVVRLEASIIVQSPGKTSALDTLPTGSPEGLQESKPQEKKLTGATFNPHSVPGRARALTSSASLVMGYLSRLEITSNTATMFRI